MARARSASTIGVIRLAGSFTRSRVKFCASARIFPRSKRPVPTSSSSSRWRPPPDETPRATWILSKTSCADPARSCPEWRLRRRGRDLPAPSHQASVFTPFCLSDRPWRPRHGAARRHRRRTRFLAPTTAKRFAANALGLMKHGQLARLAREFSRGPQLLQPRRDSQLGRSAFHLQTRAAAMASACTRSKACETSFDSMILFIVVLFPDGGQALRALRLSFPAPVRSRACRETSCLCRPPIPP